jgi:flagellar L-ring protein precursor FlgH
MKLKLNLRSFFVNLIKFCLVLCSAFLFTRFLASQDSSTGSLWKDKNPYSSSVEIGNGDIIQVIFSEGIKTDYQVEYKSDSNYKIMSNPDKKIIEDWKGFESDQSIARNSNGKSKTQAKVIGRMAVRIVGLDVSSDNLEIEGRRETRFDNDRQVVTLKGTVARKDLGAGRSVDSNRVANLELNYQAHPIPRNIQNPDIGIKQSTNPDGTSTYKAELSEIEKQEIIMKHMKRMLGESGDEGAR